MNMTDRNNTCGCEKPGKPDWPWRPERPEFPSFGCRPCPTGPAGADGMDGATGPQGIPGPVGPQGIPGERGPTGSVSPLLQPFMNSNIKGKQIIPNGGAVKFPGLSETPGQFHGEGIEYDGEDTFTIKQAGLYSLTCVLSLDNGNLPDNTFNIEIDGNIVAPAANLAGTGEVVLTRVGYYAEGTKLRIINHSGHAVTLNNSSATNSSTGHLALFRFADSGTEKIRMVIPEGEMEN